MTYAILTLLLPAIGALVAAVFGPQLSRRAISWINVGAVGAAFVLSAVAFFQIGAMPQASRQVDVGLFTWSALGSAPLHLGLLLDPISIIFMLIITGVGGLIHLYSVGYMARDDGYSRFFSYMNLFILAMLLLVMSDNFFGLLVGWAGVGLTSYLLIGFWYFKPSAVAAAKKAFVVNVVGDVGMTLAIFILFWNLGSVSYAGVFSHIASLPAGTLELVAFLLFVGAAAKSAQFPLHVWLPDAMEGPTPVSALIHAATMVTAGVYLIVRAFPIYNHAPVATAWIGGIAALTTFMAATIAIAQNDIKRILAYSTVSQLGYMFMAVATASYAAGVFHFVTHAFFKALLFLAAGSVIHALADEQDIWQMGGLRKMLPITSLTFLAATLAISGVPLFSGFFSKDEILGNLLTQGHVWMWAAGTVTAGLTAYYMFRLYFVVFQGTYRGKAHPHESPRVMTIPLVVLGVLAVIGGYLALPGVYNLVDSWLAPALGRFGGNAVALAPNWGSMAVSVALAGVGIGTAWVIYGRRAPASEPLSGPLFSFLRNKWYIDELGELVIVRPVLWLGRLMEAFDRGALDRLVTGIGDWVMAWGESLRPSETGFVRRYALSIILGAVALVAYLAIWG